MTRHWVTRYDPEYASPYQQECDCLIGHDHFFPHELSQETRDFMTDLAATTPGFPGLPLTGEELYDKYGRDFIGPWDLQPPEVQEAWRDLAAQLRR